MRSKLPLSNKATAWIIGICALCFLFSPTICFAQLFTRHWTQNFVKAIASNSFPIVGSIDGDTLFSAISTDEGVVFTNLRAKFYKKSTRGDSFIVEVYSKYPYPAQVPNYTHHFTSDSILYLRTSLGSGENDSIYYFPNGLAKRSVSNSDSTYSIYESDSLHENWYRKYFEQGVLEVHSLSKDTIIYGRKAKLGFEIRNGDTIRFSLTGKDGRVYNQIQGYKRSSHFVKGTDTVFVDRINDDTVKVSVYSPDSIIEKSPSRSGTLSISASDRITKSNVYQRFYQGKLVELTITEMNEDGHERKSFDIMDGKKELTLRETVGPFKTEQKYYENGKLRSRNVTEWDGKGGLVKSTIWHDGKKEVFLPQDMIVSGPRQCGAVIPNRQNFRPRVDSVSARVNGKLISKVFYNEIFIKVDDHWFDLESYEDYLYKLLLDDFTESASGFELSFSRTEKGKVGFNTNFPWKGLFRAFKKPSNFSYGVQLNNQPSVNQSIELTIHFGYYPQFLSFKRFEKNASL